MFSRVAQLQEKMYNSEMEIPPLDDVKPKLEKYRNTKRNNDMHHIVKNEFAGLKRAKENDDKDEFVELKRTKRKEINNETIEFDGAEHSDDHLEHKFTIQYDIKDKFVQLGRAKQNDIRKDVKDETEELQRIKQNDDQTKTEYNAEIKHTKQTSDLYEKAKLKECKHNRGRYERDGIQEDQKKDNENGFVEAEDDSESIDKNKLESEHASARLEQRMMYSDRSSRCSSLEYSLQDIIPQDEAPSPRPPQAPAPPPPDLLDQ